MSGTTLQRVEQYVEELLGLEPGAVGIQWLIMSGASLGAVVVFNLLRPKNRLVYSPKVDHPVQGYEPVPKPSSGILSWIGILRKSEDELFPIIGLDAIAYLRFCRMMRWLFLWIAVLACGVLMPINVINYKSEQTSNILQKISISTASGSVMYAHIAVTYVITGLVLYFVFVNWRRVLELRQRFRGHDYLSSLNARTLMVLSIPVRQRDDSGLRSLLGSVHSEVTTEAPCHPTTAQVAREVDDLPRLVATHNKLVAKLEKVLSGYVREGGIARKRPLVQIGGHFGLGGEKIDAIDYYTSRIQILCHRIDFQRGNNPTNPTLSYGFAAMPDPASANELARRVQHKSPRGTTITLAPQPNDIIWKNLDMPDKKEWRLKLVGFVLLLGACVLNTFPLLLINALSDLQALTQWWPWLADWCTKNTLTFSLVSKVLPPVIGIISSAVLAIIIRYIGEHQGATTKSRVDRAVIARFYAFLVISHLLVFILVGAAFKAAMQIASEAMSKQSIPESTDAMLRDLLSKFFDQIESTFISQSTYWLTWYPLRGFLAFVGLVQPIKLVYVLFRRFIWSGTARQMEEWKKPPFFDYAVSYTTMCFMATVALCYAPLSPLATVTAVVVFWCSSYIYKYQIMFVFETEVETGGDMWNAAINRILAATFFMQVLMGITIAWDGGRYAALSMVPLIVGVIIFKIVIHRTFYLPFKWYPADDKTLSLGRRAENMAIFRHPSLRVPLYTPMEHCSVQTLLLVRDVYQGPLPDAVPVGNADQRRRSQATDRSADRSGAHPDQRASTHSRADLVPERNPHFSLGSARSRGNLEEIQLHSIHQNADPNQPLLPRRAS